MGETNGDKGYASLENSKMMWLGIPHQVMGPEVLILSPNGCWNQRSWGIPISQITREPTRQTRDLHDYQLVTYWSLWQFECSWEGESIANDMYMYIYICLHMFTSPSSNLVIENHHLAIPSLRRCRSSSFVWSSTHSLLAACWRKRLGHCSR